MSRHDTFHEQSYEQQAAQFAEYAIGGSRQAQADTWLQDDTVDAWRHGRMYEALDPILDADPEASWLTVGDGRYGNDARYLLKRGANALASDISDTLLTEAATLGRIREFRKENAEALSFRAGAFDYVFCKESYHHFPRPMLALYEMLRVARKAVVLIEPTDAYLSHRLGNVLFRRAKDLVKKVLRRPMAAHLFEESGNYVYAISRREIEKVALGLNLTVVGFKGVNDAYAEGVEYERLAESGPLYRGISARIRRLDTLARLGINDHGLLVAIVFKQGPASGARHALVTGGYDLVDLPRNPYLQDEQTSAR